MKVSVIITLCATLHQQSSSPWTISLSFFLVPSSLTSQPHGKSCTSALLYRCEATQPSLGGGQIKPLFAALSYWLTQFLTIEEFRMLSTTQSDKESRAAPMTSCFSLTSIGELNNIVCICE